MEGEGSILEVTGLEKSYGRNKVLKGVDLTVRKGEVIAIIGPSGCGKSTFIRCLNLLEEPDCGKIVYKGTDLVSADKKTRSETLKDIGMVFQQFNHFPHKTVMDNVTMAPQLVSKMSKEDAEAKAEKYLKLVGMDHKKNSYPTNLSGGQQQRVSIARTLCMEPELILFDEPTSALDPEMVGIGPFIAHQDTPFCNERSGTLDDTLFYLALLRLMLPNVLLPATTALGTIHPRGREMGVLSGANVVMPNLSPVSVRKKYMLYDGKICTGDEAAECRMCLSRRMERIGCEVVTDRGDYKKRLA